MNSMSFKKSGQFPANEKAISGALEDYAITDFSFNAAESGIENATFIISSRGSKYVLRVYRHNKKQHDAIELEVNFMTHLKSAGIPVPEILPNSQGKRITTVVYDDKEWQVILMQFLPGHHAETYSETLINELATYQARIHLHGEQFAKKHPGAEKLRELRETEFIHLIPQKQLENKEIAGLISRGKEYSYTFPTGLPEGYSHFDYDAENVLSDSSGKVTGILDFDDLQYAPLVMCLAYTLWAVLITSDSPTTVSTYLQAYEAVRPLSAEEKEAIIPIVLFRHYVIAALEVLRGDMDNENLAYYLKYERFLQKASF